MEANLVSVITPSFNCEKYISATIESVLAQTYQFWEMIIVDDCSTDRSCDIVREFSQDDSRIKLLELDCNSGAAVARTIAMREANGEYMAFLDSDDLWLPQKLEKQLRFMKERDASISCTSYEQINEDGGLRDCVIKAIPSTSYNRLLLDCPVGNSTVMYSVSKLGKFEVPNIRKRNDDALWLQMLRGGDCILGIPDVLMQYRVREGSISSKKLDLVRYHWRLYRDIEHLGVTRSCFHIAVWGMIKILHLK